MVIKQLAAEKSLVIKFLSPFEKYCCKLFSYVLSDSPDVYILFQDEICGVFSYSKGGTVHSCLPLQSEECSLCLRDFFAQHKVSCVVAREDFALYLKKILNDCGYNLLEERKMLFLEYKPSPLLKPITIEDTSIIECSMDDIDKLFTLHLRYLVEEVVPHTVTVTKEAAMANLKKSLKSEKIFALLKSFPPKAFVSKAAVSSVSRGYALLGGVYTLPLYRSRGLASSLVLYICNSLYRMGKTCVLFVRPGNIAAVSCYKKSGFVPCNESYYITYYC